MSLTGQGRIVPHEVVNPATGTTPTDAANQLVNHTKYLANWTALAEAIAATRVRGSEMTDGSSYYGASSATQKTVTFGTGRFGNADAVYVSDGTRAWVVQHLTAGDGQLKLDENHRVRGATLADYTTITTANLTALRVGVGGLLGTAPEHGFSKSLTVATGNVSTGVAWRAEVRQTFVVTSIRLTTVAALANDFVLHVEGQSGTPALVATLTAGNLTQETTFSSSNVFSRALCVSAGVYDWFVQPQADANSLSLVGVEISGYWSVS
jgi:hypothetical protein